MRRRSPLNSRGVKAKGRRGENDAGDTLRPFFPKVERRRQKGNKDQGDLVNTEPFAVEVKNAERWDVHGWLKELEAEMKNAGTKLGFLMAKRNRSPFVFIVPEKTMRYLLALERQQTDERETL